MNKSSSEITFALLNIARPCINLLYLALCLFVLDPFEMGIVTLFSIFPTYFTFLHFGIFTGLARGVPMALATNNYSVEEKLICNSESIASLLGVCVCLISIVVGSLLHFGFNYKHSDFVFVTGFLIFSQYVITHTDTLLRAKSDYRKLNAILILNHISGLLSLLLIWEFGFSGVVYRLFLVSFINISTRILCRSFRIRLEFDLKTLVLMVQSGFPLLISGILFGFLTVADRSIVALTGNSELLGLFSLSSFIVQGLQVFPQTISAIYFPKMAKVFGKSSKLVLLRPLVIKNLTINALILIPVCIVLYFSIENFITNFMPKYIEGVGIAKISCLISMLWVYLGSGSVFGVSGVMKGYLFVVATSILIIWILGLIATYIGANVIYVSYSRLVGTVIVCIYTISTSLKMTNGVN